MHIVVIGTGGVTHFSPRICWTLLSGAYRGAKLFTPFSVLSSRLLQRHKLQGVFECKIKTRVKYYCLPGTLSIRRHEKQVTDCLHVEIIY